MFGQLQKQQKALTFESDVLFHRDFKTDAAPNAMTYLADGRLVSATDRVIQIWNPITGACEKIMDYRARYQTIMFLVTLNDGNVFVDPVRARNDLHGAIQLQLQNVYIGMTACRSISVLSDHRFAVCYGRNVELFDGSNRNMRRVVFEATCILGLPGWEYVVTGHYDGTVQIRDMDSAYFFTFLDGEDCGPTLYLVMLNNGSTLFSVHQRGWQFWSMEDRVCQRTFSLSEAEVCLFVMLPDGKHFALVRSSDRGKIELWNVEGFTAISSCKVLGTVRQLTVHTNGSVGYRTDNMVGTCIFSSMFHLLNDSIAILFPEVIDKTVKDYLAHDVDARPLQPLPVQPKWSDGQQCLKKIYREKLSYGIVSSAYLSCGLIAGGYENGNITVWDPENFREIVTFRGEGSPVSSLVLIIALPNNCLARVHLDRKIYIFDLEDVQHPHCIRVLEEFMPVGVVSAVGDRYFAVVDAKPERGSSRNYFEIAVWNYASGEHRYIREHGVTALIGTPDGVLLFGTWDGRTTSLKKHFSNTTEIINESNVLDKILVLALLSNGLLLSGHQNSINLWEIRTAKLVRTFFVDCCVKALVAAPDGRHFFSAHSNGHVYVWNAEKWDCVDKCSVPEKGGNGSIHYVNNISHLHGLPDGRVVYGAENRIGIIDFPYVQKLRAPLEALAESLPQELSRTMSAPRELGALTKNYLGTDYCFWGSSLEQKINTNSKSSSGNLKKDDTLHAVTSVDILVRTPSSNVFR
jgi:WD40 repeat protein